MPHKIPHSPASPIPFKPVPHKRAHRDGWTPERQRDFIATLAATGRVGVAAEAVGLSKFGAYQLRERPGAEEFAAAWDAAVRGGTDAVRDTLIDHSLNGTPEAVYHAGKLVGERRRFNHGTMKWMIDRQDKLAERRAAAGLDEFGQCLCAEAEEMRERRRRVRIGLLELAERMGILI